MKSEIRKIQNPSRSNFQWRRYAVFRLKSRSRSNQQEFDQRCSRFSEGEARSMKPSSGLAKDRTVPEFSILRISEKWKENRYNGFRSVKEKKITYWIVPRNACRSLNSDDTCYPDQFWNIQVISMTDVSPKPPMRPLPCMSKHQQY